MFCMRRRFTSIAQKRFPISSEALEPPLLYGRWLSKQYAPTSLSKLRRFVASRLRTFHEECWTCRSWFSTTWQDTLYALILS